MKKVFTKMYWALLLLTVCAAGTARAQDTKLVEANNEGATAMCRDASGNVFVLRDAGTFVESGALTANGAVDEYNSSGTKIGTVIANTGEYRDANEGDPSLALGIAVDASDNIYVTTYNDFENSIPGNIVKYFAPSYSTSTTLLTGANSTNYGYFGSLAMDSGGNLYAFAVKDANNTNLNVLIKLPGASSVTQGNSISQSSVVLIDGTTFANNENVAFGDGSTTFDNDNGNYAPYTALAVDKNNNIFIASAWAYYEVSGSFVGYQGGNLYEYTPSGTTTGYSTANLLKSSVYCSSLGCDPNGDVFGTVVTNPGSDIHTFNIVNWGTGATGTAQSISSGTTIKFEDLYPSGLAAVSATNVFMINGNDGGTNDGDVYELIGVPTSQASGFSTSNITETGATFSWTTNGGGANRAVFVALSTASPLSLTNSTTYTPSTTFTSGTQASSGWYCVYNSTTSSLPLNITGLAAAKTYQVMVVEYNGGAGPPAYQNYESGATVTAFSTPAAPTLTASGGTDSYAIGGTAATVDAGITATAGQTNLNTATIQVSTNFVTGDALNFTNQNGITGSFSGSTLTLSGSSSVANYQTALRSITFTSTSSTASTRTISFLVGDGTANSSTVTKNITVTSSTTISSLTAVTGTTTNAASVQYTATFAASVSGLSTADFTLNTSGVSGASVSGVSGSGTSWTVTVNTGSGDGTVQLAMNSSGGVTPSVSNATSGSPFTGTTYTIDKTAPTVSSINATSPSNATTTNASSVTYTVTFSEAVTGVDATDFALTTSGVSGTVSGVSGSGASYAVTVSGITGTGTLRLDLNSSGTGITDGAGNAISGGFTSGSVYTIDRTAPTVSSIALADGNPTNATAVDYTVTFSEPVTGVTSGAFSLVTTSGNAAGAISGVTAVSTSVYTVNVTGVSGNGGLRLDLSTVSGISDLNGNQLASGFTGSVYTLDNTPATLTSGSYFSNNGNSSQYAKVGDVLTLSVGYDEQLQSATMTIGGNTVPVTFSNGNQNFTGTYTMTSGDTEGNVGWTLSATDLAGNVRNYTNNDFGTELIFDKTPPAISISTPSQAVANAAATVNYTISYSDANFNFSTLSTGDITLNTTNTANAAVSLSGSGTSYTLSLSNITGEGTIGFTIGAGTAQDIPGNLALAPDPSTPFTIDNTPPTIAISAPSATSIGNNGTGSISYTVTYADANFSGSTLGLGDITLNATGTATGTVGLTGSGTSYTVTISNISGLGTLGISIGAGTATDQAGNTAPASGASATFNVLASDAVLANLTISNGNLTPGFSPGTFTYTDAIANLTSSITVLPTTDDPGATIAIDGNLVVASGVRSSSIPMSVGSNTLTIVVTAADGVTQQTYTITVTRALPNNALLSSLTLSPTATLINTSGPGAYNYTATVANSTSNIQVKPTAQDGLATITVNGSAVATGTLSQGIPLNVGANTITTVVTAQDGSTTKTYIITVNRGTAAVASLSNLAVNQGTLSPVFATSTNAYVVTVPYLTTSINFTPTVSDPNATVTVNGTPVNSGSASGPISLGVGNTSVTTVITAQNGVTKQTYNTVVTRLSPSANALLTSITTTPATTLVSTTGAGYLNYTASVSNSTTSIHVTPTATDPTATITVNGSPVASGTLSQALALNVGANTITTVLTAQDGSTTKTVIITVTRAPSTNAAMASIVISPGTLSPAFSSAVHTYSVTYNNTVTNFDMTLTTADPTATITVLGFPYADGSDLNPSLALGLNSFPVVVTAQDGKTTQTYTVNATRTPSSNSFLTSISLTPHATLVSTTGPGYYNYTAAVANSTTSVQVTAVTADATATVTVNGSPVTSGSLSQAISLNVGANTITTVVTAQDGSTKTAFITVNRAGAAVASLANLTISAGTLSPAFATGTLSYTASVPYPVSSVILTPTTTDPNATVTVNGSAATSGTGSTVALSVGLNKIITVVTAQNGVTKSTYNTYITRAAPSTNALYASIVMSPASTLVGTTGPGYLNYTTAVANSEASVQVITTAKDATATITVNGSSVASGSPSQAIALNVGANTVTVVITAQDGVTTKNAIITVNRAAPQSLNTVYEPISVTKPSDKVTLEDGITVHQAVSPNGDGINDYLTIEGIANHPENNLMIMDRNGVMVYQAKGYDNSSKMFDGHSNINGKMQLPGTYFYSLDYTSNGENKHKTGYIILKY